MKYFNATTYRPLILVTFCLFLTVAARGASLIFSYSDPVGDSTGAIDATRMVVVFDSVTGKFKLTLTATPTQPMQGQFRVNSNLFNANRLPGHSFFSDTLQDYNLANPHTKLILRGTDPPLPFWMSEDTVATNTAASGGTNPPAVTFYRTAVNNFPLGYLTNEDAIAYGPSGVATIAPRTAQDGIMIDDVTVLKEDSVINAGQANGLIAKLSAALARLNRGNATPACNQMEAFESQVQAFLNSGIFTAAQGQEAIDAAQ